MLTRNEFYFFPEVRVYSLLQCKLKNRLKEKGEGAHLMSDSPSLQLMAHFCLAGCFSAAVRKVALSVTCISCVRALKSELPRRQASGHELQLVFR